MDEMSRHKKRVIITQANGEGSGEPAHSCNLARGSTVRVRTQYRELEEASDRAWVAAYARLKDIESHGATVPFLPRRHECLKASHWGYI